MCSRFLYISVKCSECIVSYSCSRTFDCHKMITVLLFRCECFLAQHPLIVSFRQSVKCKSVTFGMEKSGNKISINLFHSTKCFGQQWKTNNIIDACTSIRLSLLTLLSKINLMRLIFQYDRISHRLLTIIIWCLHVYSHKSNNDNIFASEKPANGSKYIKKKRKETHSKQHMADVIEFGFHSGLNCTKPQIKKKNKKNATFV